MHARAACQAVKEAYTRGVAFVDLRNDQLNLAHARDGLLLGRRRRHIQVKRVGETGVERALVSTRIHTGQRAKKEKPVKERTFAGQQRAFRAF